MAIMAQYAMNLSGTPTYPDCSPASSEPLRYDQFSQDHLYHSTSQSTNESYLNKYPPATTTITGASIRSLDEWSCFGTTLFDGIGDLCSALTTTELSRTPPLPTPSRASPEYVSRTDGPLNTSPCPFPSPPSYRYSSSRSNIKSQHSDKEPIRSSSRKRARARLDRIGNATRDGAPNPHRISRTACLPHKQVERKYREGLNMGFERLRRAVPTLPQSVDAYVMGATKPTKGIVLAAAIDYIKRIERERDAALDEVERLGGNSRMSKLERPTGNQRTT